ncbi:MAG: SH3 domain-containing protein [Cocleimonas sp.]|nr:SH3 domain-containing protein [Cocleimonas sp.]
MKIRRHLKSIILASTLALSCGAMQTSFATNYQVTNVDSWDTLNVRSGAGTGYDVIGEIPASANKIKITSSERDIGGSIWVEVKWDGKSGWVNKRYLSTVASTTNNNMKQTYYNPEPATNTYTAYTPNTTTNTATDNHTHPANKCTRSISHNHAGPSEHSHRYSCQKGRQQSRSNQTDIYGKQLTAQNANTHRHPANKCTRSISHTHANGKGTHTHRYSCKNNNQQKIAYTPMKNANTHQHPANKCTRSISHTHANGANKHSHRYSCQGNKGRQQVAQTNRLQHTHGKSQCVSAVKHGHKGGGRMHRHQCPSNGSRNQSGNNHTHPANSLTRATTHSHPYQDKGHSHRYGR